MSSDSIGKKILFDDLKATTHNRLNGVTATIPGG